MDNSEVSQNRSINYTPQIFTGLQFKLQFGYYDAQYVTGVFPLYTLQQINIDPGRQDLENEFPLENGCFQGPTGNLLDGNYGKSSF